MMPPILRLFGRFELATGSDVTLPVSGARAQLLLARLALARGEWMDRGTLCTMLWGERADAQARASLRQLIWTLRQTLKPFPDTLTADGDMVRLNPSILGNDVTLFDRLAISSDPADQEAALALYRGDLLEGIDLLSLAPDGYFQAERHRLRDLALHIAASLARSHAAERNWEAVVRISRRGLVLDPYAETLQAHLVDALQQLGRQREARDQDDAFRSRLQSELGVTPAPQFKPRASQQPTSPQLPVAGHEPLKAAPPTRAYPSPRPGIWQVAGGVAVIAAVLVLGLGLGRQDSGQSATPPDPAPIAADPNRIPTRNLQAYDQYLRAEAERKVATTNDQLRAVLATYRAALTLDPTFAAAHAGYALVSVALWESSLDTLSPSLAARIQAYASAGQALQIDPDNARALIVLSRIQAQDGARQLALTTARQATKAQPDSAEAHANLALVLSYAGSNAEARAELKRLQSLDPVPRPEWLLVFGQVAFADARYGGAAADFVTLWPILPKSPLLLEHFAAALALQGRFGQAKMIRDRLLAIMPNANLNLVKLRYAALRSQEQNDALLEGLRRAGLPEWPYGFTGQDDLRITGPDLAALATDARWSGHLGNGSTFRLQSDAEGNFNYHSDTGEEVGHQFLRDNLLCQVANDRTVAPELCGPVYRSPPGQTPESQFVYVSADEVRYFSVLN